MACKFFFIKYVFCNLNRPTTKRSNFLLRTVSESLCPTIFNILRSRQLSIKLVCPTLSVQLLMHFLYVLHSVPFEDSYVVNSSLLFFSPIDKQLQRYLGSLSKCMTGYLVQRMSSCLSRSRTITAYEAQVITSQPTDMQKASRLMQIVIKKGQSACSSFLTCLGICDPVLYENVTGFPGWTIYQK